MSKDFRIFLKGEEETHKVIKYQKIGDKYNIIFNNGKQYTYSAKNVRIIESALNINRQLKLNKSDNQIKQVQFCGN